MEVLKPHVVDSEAVPLHYHHPYLISRDATDSIIVWSFAGSPTEPPSSYAVLEGKTIRPSCHLIALQFVVTFDQLDLANSVILVHSLPEGKLLDRKTLHSLRPRIYDSDTPSEPVEGECTPLVVSGGLLAIWRNGYHASDGCIEVYELSEAGKLTLMHQLHAPDGAFELTVRDIGYEYILPDPIHLTSQYLIGSLVLHPSPTLRLIRWSPAGINSSFSTTTHVELCCTRESSPDIIISATLQDHLFIPESNQLVLAHYEYPLDFVDDSPVTAIRSINPDTMLEEWCTSINQRVEHLHRHPSLGVLVAIGWTCNPDCIGITVLDVHTGQLRREDSIGDRSLYKCGPLRGVAAGVQCGMTPSADEVVVAFGDGQFAVALLSEFIVHGFVKRDIAVEGREGEMAVLVTTPCPDFSLSIPRNAKQRRGVANGSWCWVDRVFVGNGQLILKPNSGSGFAVLRWR